MGRRIEMKKIENNTKCQVTFSKRRTSLIRKAEEISFACDVDVAFLAFSPSGRISQFCSRQRMEDLFDRYVNVPTERRLSHIKNVQAKMEKLQELESIQNEDDKLQYLNNQIENLKLHIEKNQIEVQFAESNLGDFEVNPEQEASLHQLSWCERNLQQCIDKVKEKKNESLIMENYEGAMPWLYNQGGSIHHFAGSSSSAVQLQMQLESWKNNPYIDRYPENIFDEMLGKGEGKEVADAFGSSAAKRNNTGSPSIPPFNVHQFGFPETLTGSPYAFLQNNTYNAPVSSPYAMNQPQNSQLWKETLLHWQQAESSFSFGNSAGETSSFGENYLADANSYWEISMLQNQPNMFLNHTNAEANVERNENKENDEDGCNEMIVSPPPSVQAPPSASAVPSDFHDFFPSEDTSGENALWNQKIQHTHMWDRDN